MKLQVGALVAAVALSLAHVPVAEAQGVGAGGMYGGSNKTGGTRQQSTTGGTGQSGTVGQGGRNLSIDDLLGPRFRNRPTTPGMGSAPTTPGTSR
jgi:hypothetical protein